MKLHKLAVLPAILAVTLGASYSTHANSDYDKTKEIVGMAKDTVFSAWESDMVQGSLVKLKNAFAGGKDEFMAEGTYCKVLESQYHMLIKQDWFMQTGKVIQEQAMLGNEEAKLLLNAWTDTLRNTTALTEVSYPTIETFDQYWENFWLKKSTKWPGTYRCIRDERKSEKPLDPNDPSTLSIERLLVYTSIFMKNIGQEKWVDNLIATVDSMTEQEAIDRQKS
jgi:hypothetical protein